jgi:hypothetical protein
LEDDGKVRKKNRARRCKRCHNLTVVKRRKEDPVKLLKHRLYNMMHRSHPGANPALHSRDLVERVLARWDSRSVISGVTDPSELCIISYRKLNPGELPEENDFVIVTSKEAQELAKLDRDVRPARFGIDVLFKINQRQ